MSDTFGDHDGADNNGGASPSALGRPALAVVWAWVEDVLATVAVPRAEATLIRGCCTAALDSHAPALLVQGQCAGIALDHLLFTRLAAVYHTRYGHPEDGYDIGRLRGVVRHLERQSHAR